MCKKIVSVLKKRYGGSVPKHDRPILETMLYAVCLENASPSQADRAYERLGTLFHDLNEIRVSSISELEVAFDNMLDPEWRALRVKYMLQYVFENRYAFDFETLRRKTMDLAGKQLAKIKYLSPFVRSFTLQASLGSHIVPLDDQMCRAAVWLGLVAPGTRPDKATDGMKSAVRKSDAVPFCHFLRCLASDPDLIKEFQFDKKPPPEDGFELHSSPARLKELIQQADSRAKRRAARKRAAKKAKKTTKRSSAKAASSRKKTPARKKSTAQTRGKRTAKKAAKKSAKTTR